MLAPEQALRKANLYTKLGVASVLWLPLVLIVAHSCSLDIHRSLEARGLSPQLIEMLWRVFLAGWVVTFMVLFACAGEWRLQSRGTTPAQRAAIQPLRKLRRISVCCLLLAMLAQSLSSHATDWALRLGISQGLATFGTLLLLIAAHVLSNSVSRRIAKIEIAAQATDMAEEMIASRRSAPST